MTTIIGTPDVDSLRMQTDSHASSKKKIFIGVGIGVLVLAGVAVAVAVTQTNKRSSADNSGSKDNNNTPTSDPNGAATASPSAAYGRGMAYPPDAAQQTASLPTATLVQALVAALPSTVDWRTNKNVVTPIKNQQQCGSCWAFTAVEEMESAYGLKYGAPIILSTEQIIDCDLKDGGCGGGWMYTAWTQYFQFNNRPYALLDSVYPFTLGSPNGKARNTCNVGNDNGPVMVTGATMVTTLAYPSWNSAAEQTVMTYIAANGPVAVAVDATGWDGYSSGIATTASLKCGGSIDHAVSIVGFGNSNGQGYWIIRNHWSTGWGEQGYMRLAQGANTCCILCDVMAVQVAQTAYANPATAAPTKSPSSTTAAPGLVNQLKAGNQLVQGQTISSLDNSRHLSLQTDGNFVLYDQSMKALWASNTAGSNEVLKMQTDCNLVLYNSAGKAVWASNSAKAGVDCTGSFLQVNNAAGFVIINSGSTIYSSSTGGTTSAPATTTQPPSTQKATSKAAPSSLSVSSLGCYTDNANRVLPTRLTSASNSVLQDCAWAAYNAGMTYFGLEYGGECYGGKSTAAWNSLGQSTACTMPCAGNANAKCGGGWALTMYQIVSASSTAPPSASTQALDAPTYSNVDLNACTMYNGQPSYCWYCTNNVASSESVNCFAYSAGGSNAQPVYPGLCPSSYMDAATICTNSFGGSN